MLHILVTISQKFYCRKEAWGYAKVIHKKRKKRRREKKKLRKNGQVSEMLKIMGT
jgi:hypothetical protein